MIARSGALGCDLLKAGDHGALLEVFVLTGALEVHALTWRTIELEFV